MPFTKNLDFTGRERIFEQLKHTLLSSEQKQNDQYQARASLYGLGGVGLVLYVFQDFKAVA